MVDQGRQWIGAAHQAAEIQVCREAGSVLQTDKDEIYRKTLYTDWALIGSLEGAENTTYKDADIIENTEYIYTVKAVNGDSVSSFNQEGISC